MNLQGTAPADCLGVRRLCAISVPVEGLSKALVAAMHRLFGLCYTRISEHDFRRDLEAKSHVILIFDELSRLKGFSTLVVWRHVFQGRNINLLFSGDTVVEPSAWGQLALPLAFLSAAGELSGACPRTPLYWLLTTKGHRTFRFLPLFFFRFCPTFDIPQGTGETDAMDAALARDIGQSFFPDRYVTQTGVLKATPCSGALNPGLASVPQEDLGRGDVQFFLRQNPGYARGDELLCIAQMTPSNLRSFARRPFLRGMESGFANGRHEKAVVDRHIYAAVDAHGF